MSNINFKAALRYIDLGESEKAIELLKLAIEQEFDKDNESDSIEYRCVLGEYLSKLGRQDEAREEFSEVLRYCDTYTALPRQRAIAKTSIDIIDGVIKAPEDKPHPSLPIFPKPMQNKAFITQQLKKKK